MQSVVQHTLSYALHYWVPARWVDRLVGPTLAAVTSFAFFMMFAHLLLVIVAPFCCCRRCCRCLSILSYKAKISALREGEPKKNKEKKPATQRKQNTQNQNRNELETSEIPFACFIGVAFLLTEHQMGFVGQGATGGHMLFLLLLRNSSMVC